MICAGKRLSNEILIVQIWYGISIFFDILLFVDELWPIHHSGAPFPVSVLVTLPPDFNVHVQLLPVISDESASVSGTLPDACNVSSLSSAFFLA